MAPYQPTGDQPRAIEALIDGFQRGLRQQVYLGVTGAGKTFVMANVIAALNRPTLVISPNKTLAAQLCAEFKMFFPENAVEYFVSYYDYYQPEAYIARSDTYIEKDSSRNEEIDRLRHSATQSLITRRDVLVVASVSCIFGIGSPEDYLGESLALKVGSSIRREVFLRKLAELQLERNDFELARSCFRVRGEVVDIFAASAEVASRVEFFGDVVERIYEFDPLTGEKLAELEALTVFPATHYVTPRAKLLRAVGAISEELEQRCAWFERQDRLLEAQRLRQRTAFDLELLEQAGTCAGVENYSRHLTGRLPGQPPYTLFDFLPDDALIVVDESHVAIPQLGAMYGGDRSRKDALVEYGFRLPSAYDNRPLTFQEWEQRIGQTCYVSATPGPYEERCAERFVEQLIRPTGLLDPTVEVRPSLGQIDDLVGLIRERVAAGQRCLVTTLTKRFAEDLTEYMRELEIRVNYIHSDIDTMARIDILRDLRLGNFDVLVGINLLREGLDLPEVGLIAILDADKEGYLRSFRSFIQIIGRAARNVDGHVIMYADRQTESMRRAISETERRRSVQMEHNREQGITPTSIQKAVYQIEASRQKGVEEADAVLRQQNLSHKELGALIRDLEREMRRSAGDLDFERAAMLRDRVISLRRDYEEQRGPLAKADRLGSHAR